jgi:hypothetical protein
MQGGDGIYLAGFEFLPQSEPATRALAGLVEHIAALCVS